LLHKYFILTAMSVTLLAACGGGNDNYYYPPVHVYPETAFIGLALDNTSSPTRLYVANVNKRVIQSLDLSTNAVTIVAGSAGNMGSLDGTGSAALFGGAYGITLSGSNLYVADTFNQTIRKLTTAGAVTTLAGGTGEWGSLDGIGSAARFFSPEGLVGDSTGTYLYVADTGNNTVRQVDIGSGTVLTIAGSSMSAGYIDGDGATARFYAPFAATLDTGGNLYVTDIRNQSIRMISTTSPYTVTTIAGSTSGAVGSADGNGNSATFYSPAGIVNDGTYLYVADYGNHVIRKILMVSPYTVTTLAGSAGSSGLVDGTGSAARFFWPVGLALDASGNLYVSDQNFQTIRKVNTSTGAVTTLAATF